MLWQLVRLIPTPRSHRMELPLAWVLHEHRTAPHRTALHCTQHTLHCKAEQNNWLDCRTGGLAERADWARTGLGCWLSNSSALQSWAVEASASRMAWAWAWAALTQPHGHGSLVAADRWLGPGSHFIARRPAINFPLVPHFQATASLLHPSTVIVFSPFSQACHHCTLPLDIFLLSLLHPCVILARSSYLEFDCSVNLESTARTD